MEFQRLLQNFSPFLETLLLQPMFNISGMGLENQNSWKIRMIHSFYNLRCYPICRTEITHSMTMRASLISVEGFLSFSDERKSKVERILMMSPGFVGFSSQWWAGSNHVSAPSRAWAPWPCPPCSGSTSFLKDGFSPIYNNPPHSSPPWPCKRRMVGMDLGFEELLK